MRIEVTAEDIAAGVRGSVCRCPVARAVRRVAGRRWEAYGCCLQLGREVVDLPRRAQRWLARYDAGGRCRPFAFDVPLEEPPPRPRFLLVNAAGGVSGKILFDECLKPDGTRGAKNIRPNPNPPPEAR